MGAVGTFAGAGRQEVMLQPERLAEASIRLEPLALHRYKLLQEPL